MTNEPELFKTFRLLDKSELGQIKKMINSPFFKTSKKALSFFERLKRFHPEMKSKELKKEKIGAVIFPKGEDASGNKYRLLCFELNKLIKDYLIWQEVNSKTEEKETMLLDIFQRRNAKKQYELYENRLIGRQKGAEHFDEIFYMKKLGRNRIRLKEVNMNKLSERLDLLDETLDDLENFYRITKIILEAKREDLGLRLKRNKRTRSQNLAYKFNPIYNLYFILKKLKKEGTLELFFEAKTLLLKNVDFLSEERQEEMLQFLVNYLIKEDQKSDELNEEVLKELLALYEWGLSRGFYRHNGYLRTSFFLNFVVKSLDYSIEQTEKFVSDYRESLAPELKKGLLEIVESQILHKKGKLEAAFLLVAGERYSNESVNFVGRAHEIRCGFEYFKMDNSCHELYWSRLLAAEQFFQKMKNQNERLGLGALNLTRILKKIVLRDLAADFSVKTTKSLLKDLENDYYLSEKWLRKTESRFQ